jgi:hypothetical protein
MHPASFCVALPLCDEGLAACDSAARIPAPQGRIRRLDRAMPLATHGGAAAKLPPFRVAVSVAVSSNPEIAVSLTLYQRDDCHLCDLALALLAQARVPDFESVFVDGDASLEARYGTRVPVLRREHDGAELDWPFELEALQRWLAARIP